MGFIPSTNGIYKGSTWSVIKNKFSSMHFNTAF